MNKFKILSEHRQFTNADISQALEHMGLRVTKDGSSVIFAGPFYSFPLKKNDNGSFNIRHYILGEVVFEPNNHREIFYDGKRIAEIDDFDETKLVIK